MFHRPSGGEPAVLFSGEPAPLASPYGAPPGGSYGYASPSNSSPYGPPPGYASPAYGQSGYYQRPSDGGMPLARPMSGDGGRPPAIGGAMAQVPLDVVIEFPWGAKFRDVELQDSGAARPRHDSFHPFGGDSEQQRQEIIGHIETRRRIVQTLRQMGLVVAKVTTDSEYYLKIGAPDNVLMKAAELMSLPVLGKEVNDPKINAMYLAGPRPFKRSEADYFVRAPSGPSFFSSADRIRILQYLIEAPRFKGGASLVVANLIENGHILQWFPLHDEAAFKNLSEDWFKFRMPFTGLPIEKCRAYFGESVAFYFAFVDTYTRALGILSIIGIIAAVFQYTNRSQAMLITDPNTGIASYQQPIAYDSWVTGPFCVIVACGATLFAVFWTRIEAMFRFEWGMRDLEGKEHDRPAYEGSGKGKDGTDPGCFADETTWVGFEEHMPPSFFQRWIRRFPEALASQYIWRRHSGPRHFWRVLSILATIVSIVVVWTVVFALLGLRAFLTHTYSPLVASLVVGPSITVFTQIAYFVFNKIAKALTDKQNWRKQSSWDNSYVFKIFCFQFVTGYAPYFFIISVKAWQMELLPGAREVCLPSVPGGPPNCMYDLSYALLSIFTFQLLLGNVQENLIPYLKYRWQKWRASGHARHEDNARLGLVPADALASSFASRDVGATVAEANRNAFTANMVDDYAELMLQFGLVTMFAAGFPLSAALAFLNNLVEIRSDMFKYLYTMQRPFPTMAQGIGIWNMVLFGMSTVAVTTNSFILGFVSTTLNDYFNGWKHPFVSKLCFIVLVEHVVLLTQVLIQDPRLQLIHQVPKSVRIHAALKDKVDELDDKLEGYVTKHADAAAASATPSYRMGQSGRFGGGKDGYESPPEDYRR